jgi:hypothetical protein
MIERNSRVVVFLSKEEREGLNKVANENGLSAPMFLRQLVLDILSMGNDDDGEVEHEEA